MMHVDVLDLTDTAVCVQAGDCLENSHWALVLILDCHQDLSYGTVRKRKVSLRH